MKITSNHVIGAVFVIGILIYFFSKKTVSGTITADESNATFVTKPSGGSSSTGTVSYGTELGDS
jgi:hypothetical protein